MKSKNKLGYRYILTPEGTRQKYKITKAFLKRKMEEYDSIVEEITEAKKILGEEMF